ncbi:MAG: hypothetical protein LKG38_03720 [Atopobiaceae bacterium]|nr:hypothetical protein [Atopobiaceae bacterium]MCH4119047.1 hypothetical protein [Atopobiaceae bacterium]MCI1318434.1 hypothetical protein [Atopobiaceae bacterium]MCI1389525.1 hypothetical protein [Atopobiaceae bacterium]MCI1432194.1 hypothetical protein [Atopobiaceae bacterium]
MRKTLEHDPADYDVIAVGTPTWWYTITPAVASLLSAQDLAGKLVVPFMTNAGWPGSVIEDTSEAAAPATVIEPMEVRFDSNGGPRMVTSQNDVDAMGRAHCQAREIGRKLEPGPCPGLPSETAANATKGSTR